MNMMSLETDGKGRNYILFQLYSLLGIIFRLSCLSDKKVGQARDRLQHDARNNSIITGNVYNKRNRQYIVLFFFFTDFAIKHTT